MNVVALVVSAVALFVAFHSWWQWQRRAIELMNQRDAAMKIANAYRDGNVSEAQRLAVEEVGRLGRLRYLRALRRRPSEKS